MFATSREKTDKIRAMGRDKFVWRRGVLGWGIPTAITYALLMGYTQGWNHFLFMLIPALILFPIGGYFWGRWMWALMERSRNRSAGE